MQDRRPRKEQLGEYRNKEIRGHKNKVHTLAWNALGNRLASGSTDHTGRVWDAEGGCKSFIELKGHTDSVDQLCWHPSHPELLATASADKTVRLWDARAETSIHKLATQGENINICWRPTGSHIAVGSKVYPGSPLKHPAIPPLCTCGDIPPHGLG